MKSDTVIGTWDESAFQCFSLDGKTSEPLRIRTTPLGFPCVPLIGTYMEEYDPVIPTVLLQTVFEPSKVPKVVADAVFSQGQRRPDVPLFVQFHGVAPKLSGVLFNVHRLF
jgi:hypothetical protein